MNSAQKNIFLKVQRNVGHYQLVIIDNNRSNNCLHPQHHSSCPRWELFYIKCSAHLAVGILGHSSTVFYRILRIFINCFLIALSAKKTSCEHENYYVEAFSSFHHNLFGIKSDLQNKSGDSTRHLLSFRTKPRLCDAARYST